MTKLRLNQIGLRYPVFASGPGQDTPDGTAQLHRSKSGGRFVQALDGIDFALARGDRLGVIGRNGSGKSTLLRVMAGIYPPDTGTLEIEGRVAALLNIGLGMRIEATGERNIILRGLIDGLTKKEAEAHVADIAEFAELGDYIKLPVRTYSSGMAMRLNFAIATAFEPEILLLDEWIGAGDETFGKKVQARMEDLVEQAGIVVLASHNSDLIERSCNLALWLDQGRAKAFGPIDDVMKLYRA
jgi:homopolymeric O-antigen transport system ATP-binding protein